jgi:hypothetical protein
VFALLFVLGWSLVRWSPPLDASDADLRAYIESSTRRRASAIAGLYVLPLAGIAFIWFTAALRDRLDRGAQREHSMMSTVHLMAATLLVVSMFMMASIELALVWRIESGAVDLAGARSTIAIGSAVSQLIALRSGAVFVAVSTTRGLRSGLFPKWFAIASYTMAVALMLVASWWRLVLLAVPVWVVLTSWLVMSKRVHRRQPVDA